MRVRVRVIVRVVPVRVELVSPVHRVAPPARRGLRMTMVVIAVLMIMRMTMTMPIVTMTMATMATKGR